MQYTFQKAATSTERVKLLERLISGECVVAPVLGKIEDLSARKCFLLTLTEHTTPPTSQLRIPVLLPMGSFGSARLTTVIRPPFLTRLHTTWHSKSTKGSIK